MLFRRRISLQCALEMTAQKHGWDTYLLISVDFFSTIWMNFILNEYPQVTLHVLNDESSKHIIPNYVKIPNIQNILCKMLDNLTLLKLLIHQLKHIRQIAQYTTINFTTLYNSNVTQSVNLIPFIIILLSTKIINIFNKLIDYH